MKRIVYRTPLYRRPAHPMPRLCDGASRGEGARHDQGPTPSAQPLRYPVQMVSSPAPPSLPRLAGWLVVLALAVFGMAALWTMLGLVTNRQSGWVAVVAALDVVLLARLMRAPRGPLGMALAVGGTLATIAVANWALSAAQMGRGFGYSMTESLDRMGGDLGWTLIGLANGPLDLLFYALAIAVAAWGTR